MSVPLIATGSVSLTRPNSRPYDAIPVEVGFKPELVIVSFSDGTPTMFKSDESWACKAQFFHSSDTTTFNGSSRVGIFSLYGRDQGPFRGPGFRLVNVGNPGSGTAYWTAISDNGSGFMRIASYIGNNADDRNVIVDPDGRTPIAAIIKRDGGFLSTVHRPAIFRLSGQSNAVWGSYRGGAGSEIKALIAGGARVNNSRQTNELQSPSLGEGIEIITFYESDYAKVVNRTGDGTDNLDISTGISGGPNIAFYLDDLNDSSALQHAILMDSFASNQWKPMDDTDDSGSMPMSTSGAYSLSGLIRVGSEANVNGRDYSILAIGGGASS